ncbi:hypothetical protein DPMN_175242 [Dreissena polymorpha]|uniref:Uncharacterized protein n=1 Tax=Dreissena polymorpha TaxID=45954 RepID=A0A9D4IFV3_DREPO|nr:hypothetical protein DPMN_175242 [Dreissena polymorpha]
MTSGSSTKAYSTIKNLTKTSQPNSSVLSDSDMNFLTKSAAVLNRGNNRPLQPLQQDSSLLQNNPRPKADDESPSISKAIR